MFSECSLFQGEYTTQIDSLASSSAEFIERHFAGRELHDTVYITSNPHIKDIPDRTFHDVQHIYRDAWDEELSTIPPGAIVDAAKEAAEEYPNKRLLIHFMQPHYPFIGKHGGIVEEKGIFEGHVNADGDGRTKYAIWTQLDFGFASVTEDEIWKAYRGNLGYVAEQALSLVDGLEGKTVITSDHGNLVGESIRPVPVRVYGHPNYVRSPRLTAVPWYEPPFNHRKRVISEPPETGTQEEIDTEVVEDRLKDLGYA